MSNANKIQYGGTHYKQFTNFEPWDVITAWDLGYLDGTAVKYLARWKHKGGVEDLKKAKHFIEKAIEVEEGKQHESFNTTDRIYASVWNYADSFRVDDKMDETTKACCKLGCGSPSL